jgi:hypothetical protein
MLEVVPYFQFTIEDAFGSKVMVKPRTGQSPEVAGTIASMVAGLWSISK